MNFELNELVNVASRTGPGQNNIGGVGKIVKINNQDNTVNIKYIFRWLRKEYSVKLCNKKVISTR